MARSLKDDEVSATAGIGVVGVVASAGGLEAFKQLLTHLPPSNGMALVLVPHLDPTHESLMVDLLSKQTSLPVLEAADGMAVEADHIYVIPPNKYLTIQNGRLRLHGPVDRTGGTTSIDSFLRSLAEDQHECAVGIVLSGTGSHGAQGLREIKANGGLAIAQDPATAAYPSMPESAIATGMMDYVLPVQQMPEALLEYVRKSYFLRGEENDNADVAEEQLAPILSLLRTRMRHDFSCYRKKTLLRRIERRMGLNRIREVNDYVKLLNDNPAEFKLLAKDLLISVTNFFRDPEAFRALEREILPTLLKAKQPEEAVRIWVPAAATGEEPYSLAMLALEQMARGDKSLHLQVFATDVDEDALAAARLGIYPEGIADDVGAERLAKYFTRADDHSFQVTKPLREVVTFAMQNLVNDAPFSRMDLISCRNLLIYLEPEMQQKVIALFHFALREGGYLLLGSSETIGRRTDLFEPVSKKWRIYRRIGPNRTDAPVFPGDTQRGLRASQELAPARALRFVELTQQLLLSEFAPAAVLINRASQVMYFHGQTTQYLEQPTGEPTRDLHAMARPGLHAKLRAIVGKAIADSGSVISEDALLQRGNEAMRVRLTCRAMTGPKAPEGLLLVTFEDVATVELPSPPEVEAGGLPLAHDAERELDAIRADLQSTITEMESTNEDLKAANEEMTAMNEELQSVNEELETSREELQSLNEELTSVNGQLSEKVEEIESTNNDLANLFNSTDTATLFLSEDDRIRRFTPAATKLFNLIPADVGRPISDLSHKFLDDDLRVDTAAVLEDLAPREKEVQSADGSWYIRRVLPYRTLDNRIEGVVVTFSNVTTLKQAEVALRRNQELKRLATVVTDSNDAIAVRTTDGKIVSWNRGAEKMYGYPESTALGMNLQEIIPAAIQSQEAELFARVCRGESVRAWQTQRIAHDGRILDVDLTATPLPDESGTVAAISTTERDITQQKAMIRQMGRLAAIVESSGDAIIGKSLDGTITDWNSGAEKVYRYPASVAVGQPVTMLSPANRQHEMPRLLKRVRAGESIEHFETVHIDQQGLTLDVSLTISPIKDAEGAIVGAATIARDISDRKQLERKVLETADAERRRIGQDLHDETGQELTGLGLISETLAEALQRENSTETPLARKISQGIKQAISHVRALARGLIPVEIDSAGLMAALASLAARISEDVGVDCAFVSTQPVLVEDNTVATHLFRIAQEAIGNALKHGKPRRIEIELISNSESLVLTVQDDGSGFRQRSRETEGMGLRIMRHRAALIGAELQVEARAGAGVQVRCVLNRSPSSLQELR